MEAERPPPGGARPTISCTWEVMRRAADRGSRLFDFGRSKIGTGSHDFKKNWGFTPENLNYRYMLAPGASIPDHNPLNPKYRLVHRGMETFAAGGRQYHRPLDRARIGLMAKPNLLFLMQRLPYPLIKGEKIAQLQNPELFGEMVRRAFRLPDRRPGG